jgi:PhnB protein
MVSYIFECNEYARKSDIMAPTIKWIPDGYHSVTPHLINENASRLIEFLQLAFEAEEITRLSWPDGRIMHAELKIGDSIIMIGEASEEWKPMPASITLYVENVDATYARALEAGATSIREPANQFYGDRSGGVKDLAGNHWWIATHIEEIPPQELRLRAEQWMKERIHTQV